MDIMYGTTKKIKIDMLKFNAKDDKRVTGLSKKAKVNFILQSGYRNASGVKSRTEDELMAMTDGMLVDRFYSIILEKSKETTSQSFRGKKGSDNVTVDVDVNAR